MAANNSPHFNVNEGCTSCQVVSGASLAIGGVWVLMQRKSIPKGTFRRGAAGVVGVGLIGGGIYYGIFDTWLQVCCFHTILHSPVSDHFLFTLFVVFGQLSNGEAIPHSCKFRLNSVCM
jgi:hypothetical protein